MLQFFALLLFSTVMIIAVAAIVATVKEELPYILRALGLDPAQLPRLHETREPRVRVIRQGRPVAWQPQRAAA